MDRKERRNEEKECREAGKGRLNKGLTEVMQRLKSWKRQEDGDGKKGSRIDGDNIDRVMEEERRGWEGIKQVTKEEIQGNEEKIEKRRRNKKERD